MKRRYGKAAAAVLGASMVLNAFPYSIQAFETDESTKTATVSERFPNGFSEDQNRYEIYPVPHSIDYGSAPSELTVTESVNVVYEDGVDSYTKAFLDEVLSDNGIQASTSDAVSADKTNILVGINGSGEYVDSYYKEVGTAGDLFGKNDAYAINVSTGKESKGTVVILGKDTDAAFYGIASLKMMFSSFANRRLLEVDIKDYSDGKLRGFIEGFYDSFNYDSREDQMRMLRDVKGNLYVFASKTDPYHGGSNWRATYPADELAKIEHLVQVGKETKVRYAWSFHVGKSNFFNGCSTDESNATAYANYQANLNSLIAKFEQLYAIGVRDFHILNDDYNSGNANDVVVLLNDIDDWLKEKGDCGPIVYCPNNYNMRWSSAATVQAELNSLQKLHDGIYLYWTGEVVNSPINQTNITYPYTYSNHYPVTWLNYPCSEHDKSGIYLGNISQYISEADGVTGQMGLLSNPVNYPQANKVAYFQLMSWVWNHDNYTDYTEELWIDSFKYLQPEVYDAYVTLARNISNCPTSGRWTSGFPESEYIKDQLTSVKAKILNGTDVTDDKECQELMDEFENILAAIKTFRANCANADLVAELNPFMTSLEATTGAALDSIRALNALNAGNVSDAWGYYSKATAEAANYMVTPTPAFPEKMAQGGSLRIHPFAEQVLSHVGRQIMPALDPGYSKLSLYTNKEYSAAREEAMFDGDPSTTVTWNVVAQVGDYYGVDLGNVIDVHSVKISQGNTDSDHDRFYDSVLEYSVDGQNWTAIDDNVNAQIIDKTGLDIQARYIRLRATGFNNPNNTSKKDYWTHVRDFEVNYTEKAASTLYTNSTTVSATESKADRVTTLNAISGTLNKGEYIGIDAKALIYADAVSVSGNPAGLKLQYSENSVEWKDLAGFESGDTLRYVRVLNEGDAAVSVDGMSLSLTESEPRRPIVTSNISTLKEGSWSNLVDGKKNTNVWTGVNQAAGQWIQVDLQQTVPFEMIQLFMSEQRPRLYHADIKISANGTDWTTAFSVDAANDNTTIDGQYRMAMGTGNGEPMRYVKIELTDAANEATDGEAYLNLFELVVNGGLATAGRPSAVTGSESGNLANAADGDLSTFYTPRKDSGYIEYQITENNDLSAIRILQAANAVSNAKVSMKQNGSYVELGTLDQAVTLFDLKDTESDAVTAIKIEWTSAAEKPSIYEIITLPFNGEVPESKAIKAVGSLEPVTARTGTALSALNLPGSVEVTLEDGSKAIASISWSNAGYNSAKAGTYTLSGTLVLPNTLSNPDGLKASITVTLEKAPVERTNLALNKPVQVSGVEVAGQWPGEGAVDGDKESAANRWSSGIMKQGTSADQVQTEQWLIVDLGEGVNTIDQIDTYYYLKVYATDYDILVSDDGDSWTKLDVKGGLEPSTTVTNPTESITLDPPVQARYVQFLYKAINHNAGGNALSIRELEIYGNHEDAEEEKPNVTEVKAVSLSVPYGTALSGINPDVDITLDDGSTISLKNLNWTGTYDPKTAGTYTLSADLPEDDAWTNTASLKATASVTVEALKAVSAASLEAMTVPAGTTAEDLAAKLPKTVSVTFSDGSTADLDVEWDLGGWTAEAGKYELSGTIATDANHENPDNVKAAVEVTVEAQVEKAVLESGAAFEPVSKPVKTAFEDLGLPEKADVTLSDGSTISVDVTWNEDGYDPESTEEQTITGTYVLDDIENPNDLIPAISVKLIAKEKTKEIVSLGSIAPVTVEYGTAAKDLSLPEMVNAVLDDDSDLELSILWNLDDYDPETEGAQTIYGTVELPEGVINPEGLQAEVSVIVKVPEVQTVDTKALEELLTSVNEKDFAKDAAMNDYLALKQNAQSVLNKADKSQEEVDKAHASLKESIGKLNKKAELAELSKAAETLKGIDPAKLSADQKTVYDRLSKDLDRLNSEASSVLDQDEIDRLAKDISAFADSLKPADPGKTPGGSEDDPKDDKNQSGQTKPDQNQSNQNQTSQTKKPGSANTGVGTGLAGFGAAFSALGALLISRKRRNKR